MQEAKFWQPKDNKVVGCELCHHRCIINKGKTGICRVRKNEEGLLYSLVYGCPVAINIDPVEKKPLFHFQPGSQTYSLGTYGCNFTCANCQNWDISQAKALEGKIASLNYHHPEKIVAEALSSGCRSISYTYNEPTVFAEYALDIMKLAHQEGLKNVWVSNGYMSGPCLDEITPFLDAVNIDLKSMDPKFYINNCGAKLEPVLENLKRLKADQVHLEITTLVIPELADDMEMLKELAEFIVDQLNDDTPWHLSRFTPSISWKLKTAQQTGEDRIYEAYEIGKNAGLKYVYVGNLPGDQKENTYCPRCGEMAIRRFGYEIERSDDHGVCAACDKPLDIID